jgi:hypothetical protein
MRLGDHNVDVGLALGFRLAAILAGDAHVSLQAVMDMRGSAARAPVAMALGPVDRAASGIMDSALAFCRARLGFFVCLLRANAAAVSALARIGLLKLAVVSVNRAASGVISAIRAPSFTASLKAAGSRHKASVNRRASVIPIQARGRNINRSDRPPSVPMLAPGVMMGLFAHDLAALLKGALFGHCRIGRLHCIKGVRRRIARGVQFYPLGVRDHAGDLGLRVSAMLGPIVGFMFHNITSDVSEPKLYRL